MSCCSDLMVFMQFYRQSATWSRRHDALLGGLCSFGPTFYDNSVPPDAVVCIFIVRDGREDGKNQPLSFLFFVFWGFRACGEPLKEGYSTVDSDLRHYTADL